MKKIILIALIFIGLSSNAQYFQHEYGGAQSGLTSGINTKIHPPGHVMVGAVGSSLNELIVTYTDEFGVPYFNNVYSNIYGVGAQVVETPNGFGIVGMTNHVAYMPISLTGVAGPTFEYPIAGASGVIFATAATTSASGNEIYITGTTYNTLGDYFMFIIKIDINGNLLWSNIYDITGPFSGPSFDRSYDIIESPYSPTGVTEVIVVGGIVDNNPPTPSTPNSLGYLMRVNANTGTMIIPWPVFYGGTNQKSYLTSIEVANSPTAGGSGFILSGADDNIGKYDFWVMKTDPTGSILWSNTYDYGFASGYAGISYSAIERLNTQGNYEYYAAGLVSDPNKLNVEDVVAQKIDDLGNPYPQGEFTYFGLIGTYAKIDQYNGTTHDGISIFCSKQAPATGDMYHIKAYFNGRSGCNETFSDPNPGPGPSVYGEGYVTIFGSFGMMPYPVPNSTPLVDNQICYSTTLPDGNNALKAPDDEGTISPNPFTVGTVYASLELEVDEPTAVTVSVYDMLGRNYYTHNFNLIKGKNNLSLDISEANMAAGMYSVRITGKNLNKNIMLMVK